MGNRRKTLAERAVSKAKRCRVCRSKEEIRKGPTVYCADCSAWKREEV